MAGWDETFGAAGTPKGKAWDDFFTAAAEAAKVQAEPDRPTDEVGYGLRAAAGSARTPAEMLATIRQSFPDAALSDKGTAVFTSPKTGRPTYFNPPGLDTGDLAAGARMVAEAAGGTAGGVLGAVGGPVGSVAGAAARPALAGQGVDLVRRLFGLPQDASAEAVGRNVVGDVVGGAAGELGGKALAQGVKLGAQALVRPGAQATLAAAKEAGLPATASMTMRGPVAALETTAAQVLPGSRPSRTLNQFYDTAENLIGTTKPDVPNPPGNVAEAAGQGGATLKEAASRFYDQWKQTRLKLDNDFYAALPSGARFKLPSVAKAATDLQAEVAQSPGVAGEALKPVQDWLDRIGADMAANGGALPANALRKLRTQLGAELETGATTELAGPVQARLKQLYAGINADMKAGAAQLSPTAAAKLARHDALVTAFRGEDLGRDSVAEALDSVLKKGSDEQAWNAFANGGVEQMRRLVGTLQPDELRVVARAAAERMTRTPAGNEATPTQWASQWLSKPDEVRRLLFGGVADVDQLNAAAQVLRQQQKNVPFVNTSRTAYELQRAGLLGALSRGGMDLLAMGKIGVDPLTTLKGAAAGYAGSELLTHPRVIKGVVEAANAPASETALKRMIAQLMVQGGLQ